MALKLGGGRIWLERSGRTYELRVDEPCFALVMSVVEDGGFGFGISEYSQELFLFPHLLNFLQFSESLLQESNGGVQDCGVIALPPHEDETLRQIGFGRWRCESVTCVVWECLCLGDCV